MYNNSDLLFFSTENVFDYLYNAINLNLTEINHGCYKTTMHGNKISIQFMVADGQVVASGKIGGTTILVGKLANSFLFYYNDFYTRSHCQDDCFFKSFISSPDTRHSSIPLGRRDLFDKMIDCLMSVGPHLECGCEI